MVGTCHFTFAQAYRTYPRVNPNVNQELWVMMCQRRVVAWNKGTTLVRDVDSRGGCSVREQGIYGNSLTFLLDFAVNLKFL